jgi:membrane protease YdiL (CAAX protease family)
MHYTWKQFTWFYILALLIAISAMAFAVASGQMGALGELFDYLELETTYPNVVSIGSFALSENSGGFIILLFAAAPSLAAIMVAAASPKLRLGNLLARLKPIGPDYTAAPVGLVYTWLFAAYLGILAVYMGVTVAFGEPESVSRSFANLGSVWPIIIAWCIAAPFFDEGGLLEELGWRGFAWPALQSMLSSPLRAAILLGALWWAWHLPRELSVLLGEGPLSPWLGQQGWFLMLCIAETIVCVYLVNLCGGSVLPAIIVHGGSNVWSKAVGSEMWQLTGVDVRTWIMLVAAVIVVALVGNSLGRQVPHRS